MKSKRMEIYIHNTHTYFLKKLAIILISYEVDFRTRTITRNLKKYFIMTKVLNDKKTHKNPKCQGPNNTTSKYMKQNLTS